MRQIELKSEKEYYNFERDKFVIYYFCPICDTKMKDKGSSIHQCPVCKNIEVVEIEDENLGKCN